MQTVAKLMSLHQHLKIFPYGWHCILRKMEYLGFLVWGVCGVSVSECVCVSVCVCVVAVVVVVWCRRLHSLPRARLLVRCHLKHPSASWWPQKPIGTEELAKFLRQNQISYFPGKKHPTGFLDIKSLCKIIFWWLKCEQIRNTCFQFPGE